MSEWWWWCLGGGEKIMADKLGVAWTWLLIAGHMKIVPKHFNKK